MTYETANEQLTGRNRDRRKLANNTYLERRGQNIAVRLHSTDIATFRPDGSVTLDSGGWRTVTTKARMNEFADWPGSQRYNRIWSDRGVWYLGVNDRTVAFADGITIHRNGRITGEAEDPKGIMRLKRQISRYAHAYINALMSGELPAPGAGDCWFCAMTITSPKKDKGKGLGEAYHDTEHLTSHMQEKYYVPALLMRAVKRFPVSRVAEGVLAELWGGNNPMDAYPTIQKIFGSSWGNIAREQLQRSLRRYITEQFGMQA